MHGKCKSILFTATTLLCSHDVLMPCGNCTMAGHVFTVSVVLLYFCLFKVLTSQEFGCQACVTADSTEGNGFQDENLPLFDATSKLPFPTSSPRCTPYREDLKLCMSSDCIIPGDLTNQSLFTAAVKCESIHALGQMDYSR